MTDTKKQIRTSASAQKLISRSVFDIDNPPLGLDNLATGQDKIIMIDTKNLVPNPNQPRKHFDQDSIQELADSIREYGLIQPIIVRRVDGRYQIVAGERRHMASLEAELYQVPCILIDVDDAEAFKISLVENLQREDLDPFEEANGYKQLQDMYGMTQEDIARTVKKKQPTVSEIMSLNKLPEPIRSNYRLADISRKHLVEIAKAESEDDMTKLIELTQNNQLSANDLRNARRNMKKGRGTPKSTPVYLSLVKNTSSYDKALSKLSSSEPSSIPYGDRTKLIKKLEYFKEKTEEVIRILRQEG
mgnify:FL=1